MTIIQTYTGKRFDLMNPDPEKIEIVDIAWALSMIPRFTGHTRKFYSVAQHSMCVAQCCDAGVQFEGLMHDAAEAYIGDVSSPVKQVIKTLCGDSFKIIENVIQGAIALRFGLVFPTPAAVKVVDLRMLETERQDLMIASPDIDLRTWYDASGYALPERLAVRITPFSQEDSFNSFLNNFSILYNDRVASAAQEQSHAVKSGAVTH